MISGIEVSVRGGSTQGILAFALAAATAAIVAVPNWSESRTTGQFAVGGVFLFGLALAAGSPRTVGAATLPLIGSALAASASSSQTQWIQSIVVGCLCYLAVELAWDSIDRRTATQRSAALDLRRVNEVSTVVVIALGMTVTAYAAASFDATRTIGRQALVIAVLLAAFAFAVRHVAATSPSPSE